ncbi:MAG: hypothetical protein KYX66_18135 [Blastomonas fulva]|uniref:hypothetical protein n=1 Tax=Blastomonas fulva TaxID=1550728 RepID=UPI0024E1E7CC|nr:hypothetical protein [Blastomonas fulva]MDK2758648.1 hypothetical protein [Blastomonas fulva]
MEEALVARLRASAAIVAVAGVYNNRAAIDVGERRSDRPESFPACFIDVNFPGRMYDQDGSQGLHIPRIRFECFGRTWLQAKQLGRAITELVETPETVGGIRFHRGAQLVFERNMTPEDLGGGIKVFRNLRDMTIPYTPT